LFKITII